MEETPREKTTAVKATDTSKRVRSIVKSYYMRAQEASEKGAPIAYCMVASCYDEILLAMDVVPIWTENYSGLCAAKRDAERFILKAEAEGYSNVICGYARCGIGFDILRHELGHIPPESPDGGMARPSMLLGSSAVCDPRYKWYQSLGRYLDTPIYNFDIVVPPIDANLADVKEYYVKYQLEQFKGLVTFIERQTGKKMDYDRLSEILDIADETNQVWLDCYKLRSAIPGPMPSQDHFSAFVPAFYGIGTKETLDFYRELYNEVKYRVDNKMSTVPEEKYRLLWAGGLPPWHTMWIFNYFESRGGVFVMDTTYGPWGTVEVPKGITHPLERLAWRTFLRWTNRYEKAQKRSGNEWVELILDIVDDYHIDGMAMHATKSCRATTMGQIHMKNLAQDYVKIPTLLLISDIVDVRDYSEAEWKANINAFMETVDSNKRGKKG